VFLSSLVVKVIAEASIHQPFSELGAISEIVLDQLDAVGKQQTQGRDTRSNALVKAAGLHACDMQNVRGRHC